MKLVMVRFFTIVVVLASPYLDGICVALFISVVAWPRKWGNISEFTQGNVVEMTKLASNWMGGKQISNRFILFSFWLFYMLTHSTRFSSARMAFPL
jgi:hypothetical protein